MIQMNDMKTITYNGKKFLKRDYIAIVSNDKEGWDFINKLKVENPDKQIRCKGRHSDRKGLYKKLGKVYSRFGEHTVPIKHAERLGIYLYDKEVNNNRNRSVRVGDYFDKTVNGIRLSFARITSILDTSTIRLEATDWDFNTEKRTHYNWLENWSDDKKRWITNKETFESWITDRY